MRTFVLALAVLLSAVPAFAGTRTFTASETVAVGPKMDPNGAAMLCRSWAKRTALEQAGARITSNTTVKDGAVQSDIASLFTEAFAKVEVLDEKTGKDNVSCKVAVTVDPEEVRRETASALKNKGMMKVLRWVVDRTKSNTLILDRIQKQLWGKVYEAKFTEESPLFSQ
ncbi:MAG: hypothetical protein AB7D07_16000 [Desulfovibrionaceae bacterium]